MTAPDARRSIDDPYAGEFRPGPQAPMMGMWLFLAALGMLFASSMLGYVLIRTQSAARAGSGTLHLPTGLWASTVLILASSFTLHRSVQGIRRERQGASRRSLAATLVLAGGFVLVQVPCLWRLLAEHRVYQGQGLHLYGLIFFLILLHGLHVVGGIASLARVAFYAFRGRYDHEHFIPVRRAAVYWHFLDVVWIAMFTTMQLVG